MSVAESGLGGREDERRYLCVDRFLANQVDARALTSAFELGIIDRLLEYDTEGKQHDGHCDLAAWREMLDLPGNGAGFLLDLLRAAAVVELRQDRVVLSEAFSEALLFRDLLEAKLDFANLVLPDLHEHFTQLLRDPAAFMQDSRIFELFRYDRCFDSNPDNRRLTQRWVRFTSTLTKYESQACINRYDFARHRRMLDVGGNSGEFVLRICKAFPAIQATVFDLPVVCELGEAHVRDEPEAGRIGFVTGDARFDSLPAGHDLISFKSFLHDWPEQDARQWLHVAHEALAPGGTLLIYERGPIEYDGNSLPYAMIPHMLFLHAYRDPGFYVEQLEALGMEEISVVKIDLEMPFYLLSARKTSGG